MKKIHYTAVCVAVTLCLLLHGCNNSNREKDTSSPPPAVDDRHYVAHVNGDGITVDDLQWYLAGRPDGGRTGNSDDFVKGRFQELVSMKVLALEAKRRRIDQDPATKFAIEQMLAHKLLEDQVNKPALERQIPDSEVEAFYNAHQDTYVRPRQIRLADIFIAVPQDAPAAIRDLKEQQAKGILAEALQTGKERFAFATLIKENSDQHPLYGKGDTGFFDEQGKPLGLGPDFVEEAFAINEKGKVFERLIKTADGFHVVMLVGERPAENTELADVSAEIRQQIRRNEINKNREKFIQELTSQASLEISADRINSILEKK